jgi:serine/threonine protein kinase
MAEVLSSRYDLGPVIGSGAYGNVFRATHKLTKIDVAIKMIPKSLLERPSALSHFQAEVNLLKGLNHPRIIRLFELVESPTAWYLVTELASKGDLLEVINCGESGLGEKRARAVFAELLQGVTYLHEQCHMVHRDLKPENLLLDRNDHIRIIDFGFAKLFSDSSDVFSSRCGSPAYVAPEIVSGGRYTATVDVWSLGVILYAMALGQLPFDGDTIEAQLRRIVFSRPSFPSSINSDLRSLLMEMLDKNGDSRIPLAEISSHPWMRNAEGLPPFVARPIDPDRIARLAALGVFVREFDLENGIDTEAAVAYKIIERDDWVRAEQRGPSTPVKAPASPMIASSPMTPSRRPAVSPLNSPTPKRRGGGSENQAERANGESPCKRHDPSTPVRHPGPRTSAISPRRVVLK